MNSIELFNNNKQRHSDTYECTNYDIGFITIIIGRIKPFTKHNKTIDDRTHFKANTCEY